MKHLLFVTVGLVTVMVLIVAGVVAFRTDDDSDAGAAQTSPTPSRAASTPSSVNPPVPTETPMPEPTQTPTRAPEITVGDVYDANGTVIENPEIGPDGLLAEVVFDEDGVPHLIPPDQVEGGGVGRDGIPSIDKPHIVGPDRWAQMGYHDDWLVIGVEINGKQRAYPFQIIVWHEVVNDTFEGVPLLVTF